MTVLKFLFVPLFAGLMFSSKDNNPGLSNANNATSYTQEFFNYIRCHRQAKNIVVNWGTTSLSGVHHFVVYHSELGDFYDPIGQIIPDGSLKYSYKHESVLPGYHYYYIAAVMNSGPAVNSPVDIVRIVGH